MSTEEKKRLQKSYFDVLGLCCSSEVPMVENILKSIDGIKDFSVIVPTKTLIVVHDNLLISQLQIVKELNKQRLEANVKASAGDVGIFKKKWPNKYTFVCGLLLSIAAWKYMYHPLQWVALAAVAVGLFPILRRAYASIKNFRFADITILILISVIATSAMGDFLEAATIVFFFNFGDWLESRAGQETNAVMQEWMNITPQKAVIAQTGEEVEVEMVKLNTILAVKAGQAIPIDGIVVDGECDADERTLTGESFPVSKQKDSTVWAGTMNLNGYISVKTTALAEDCLVSKMTQLVEEAQNNKSQTERFINKCVKYYTPAVILISMCFAVIPAALRVHNLKHWLYLALVVLVSACPCALVLSTPVATFCAITKAAHYGLLIKGGEYLETLAKIKVMAFDKTGTVTRGEFVVTDFRSLCDDISIDRLLYWVSSIESKSSHPMAAALVEYGRSLCVEQKPEDVEEFQNFPSEGIYGKIEGKDIYIGNRKIALRAGCRTVPTTEGDSDGGKGVRYIFSGATPAGIFSLSDACRTGVDDAIKELKSLGIKTAMLTGDSNAAATHVQEQLDNAIDLVHAELLPEDKAKIIEGFKEEGRTAMIGDGVNDAPALATADIGISMGVSGSALATETGHVILMSNDLRKIPKAIKLARKAHQKVIQNVVLSFSTKAGILALAFTGHPLVWAAVLADAGTCLIVTLNSMLLSRGTHKHGAKSAESRTKHEHNPSGGSHKHQHCCSQKKKQVVCEPKKCSTATCQPNPSGFDSCGTNKCSDLHQYHKCCDHSNRNTIHTDAVAHDHIHNHGCSGSKNLNLHPEHEGENEVHVANHVNHTIDIEEGNKISESSHCHSIHSSDSSKTDSCCNHHHQDTTIDDPPDHMQSVALQACMSLEKREVGTCCKLKQCCNKVGHLGFVSGFGGGLSEVVIE
ncbi:putative inactive cadmium/zinc-transporting ATPase HMA3 [Tripterygium wilfordii]|uniref:Putative inactive cadmium/zinc-transporting ATPase HMA3 n=1 Tax=Tripterygium wilfordii TaxID=458696 RepID=A0A7J7D956_TRIWF|nr:putative inactive cadmium/zinc-transporting ATPase HMA3 [Tripterygium wilfordii]KAF5742905.1 putative inactive cadmium/zinc-transporting ATPase HMA3 [Tripterygium wilfordii]